MSTNRRPSSINLCFQLICTWFGPLLTETQGVSDKTRTYLCIAEPTLPVWPFFVSRNKNRNAIYSVWFNFQLGTYVKRWSKSATYLVKYFTSSSTTTSTIKYFLSRISSVGFHGGCFEVVMVVISLDGDKYRNISFWKSIFRHTRASFLVTHVIVVILIKA